jgi:hypothetical protein
MCATKPSRAYFLVEEIDGGMVKASRQRLIRIPLFSCGLVAGKSGKFHGPCRSFAER